MIRNEIAEYLKPFMSEKYCSSGHGVNDVIDQRDSGSSEEENDQMVEINNDQDSSDDQLTPPEAMTPVGPPLSDPNPTSEDTVWDPYAEIVSSYRPIKIHR